MDLPLMLVKFHDLTWSFSAVFFICILNFAKIIWDMLNCDNAVPFFFKKNYNVPIYKRSGITSES